MSSKHRYIYLFSILVILQLSLIFFQLSLGRDFTIFVWYCNHIILLTGIYFLLNRDDVIRGIIYIGIVPQLIWLFDVFYFIFFGIHPLNITNYVFEFTSIIPSIMSIIIHILGILIPLYFALRKEPETYELFYSFFYIVFLYIISLIFLPFSSFNLNCVDYNCLEFYIPFYSILWPILTFLLVALPTFLIIKLLFRLKSKKSK